MELASIIVPVYNVEKWLPECIESIINQTYQNWELILVDDGSTDKSPLICDNYVSVDSRIRVIHKSNEGVSIARNLGIKESNGKWLFFIDSDDWVDSNYIQEYLDNLSGDDSIVYGSMESFYMISGKHTVAVQYDNVSKTELTGDIITKYKLFHNGFPVAKVFNRKILIDNKLQFNPELSFHEDHLFVFQYMKFVKYVSFLADCSYHYRHEESHASLSSKKHKPGALVTAGTELLTELASRIKEFNVNDKCYIRTAITDNALNHIMLALLQADTKSFREIIAAIQENKLSFFNYYYPNHYALRVIALLFSINKLWMLNYLLWSSVKSLYNKYNAD